AAWSAHVRHKPPGWLPSPQPHPPTKPEYDAVTHTPRRLPPARPQSPDAYSAQDALPAKSPRKKTGRKPARKRSTQPCPQPAPAPPQQANPPRQPREPLDSPDPKSPAFRHHSPEPRSYPIPRP